MTAKARPEYLRAALGPYSSLNNIISELTEDELREALEVEYYSQRRRSHLERMVPRLVHLVEAKTKLELTRRYL